jgi:hypothetical protein
VSNRKFRIYDGVVYKDIECTEILTSDNKPTGHYTKNKETQVSILGGWLDIKDNYDDLAKQIEAFFKQSYYTPYNYIFTDYDINHFFFTRSVNYGAVGVTNVDSIFAGIIAAI